MKSSIDALLSLVSEAEWVSDGKKITQWLSPDIAQPTQAEIDAEITRLQAEHNATQYQRDRQAEYPSIDELIVALWEGVVEERMASVTALEGRRQAIKEKYPKD
jgi:hypothetical protein